MKPPSKLGFGLLGLSLLLSCNPKPPPDIIFAEPPVESAPLSGLNDYFLKRFPSNEPGGAVLIMSGDSILFSPKVMVWPI